MSYSTKHGIYSLECGTKAAGEIMVETQNTDDGLSTNRECVKRLDLLELLLASAAFRSLHVLQKH